MLFTSPKSIKRTAFSIPVYLCQNSNYYIIKNSGSANLNIYSNKTNLFYKQVRYKSKNRYISTKQIGYSVKSNSIILATSNTNRIIYSFSNPEWIRKEYVFEVSSFNAINKKSTLKNKKSSKIVSYDSIILKDPRVLDAMKGIGFYLNQKNDLLYLNFEASEKIYIYNLSGNLIKQFGIKGKNSNSDTLHFYKGKLYGKKDSISPIDYLNVVNSEIQKKLL